MNIKRFDTYRGVVVDKNGTKGDVAREQAGRPALPLLM